MNTVMPQMILSSNAIINSNVGKGLIRLLDDAKGFLLIAGISVCILMLLFLFTKKSMVSDHEQLEVQRHIKGVFFAAVGIVSATALIALVTSYFL